MTQKHTPTPWIADQGYIFDDDNNIVAELYAPANAAHIVKCVNMHDELVEVLSGLMKVYNEPDETICCNGYHCACLGATVRKQAEYYARETLKKAGAL